MALTKVTGGVIQSGTSINVGVVTATTIQVGSAVTIHSGGYRVGSTDLHSSGLSIQNINATGVITATSFIGDISQATGAAAGLGTALSQVQASPLNKLYYTDKILSVGSTITVDPPSSSNIAYTQYSEIVVEQDADLIVEDGDDLVPDILGLSTGTAAPLSGAGGRVRADNFTNKAGTGAPTFPNGVNVTGVVTATSFSGDGSALTGIDATSLKDSGGNVKIQANTSGASVTGVLTATNFLGNLSGNVNAGVVTATSSIVVGNSFINPTSIGIGTTTTAGRNAGIGTAVGTIIYNSTNGAFEGYNGTSWDQLSNIPFIATGGTEDTTSRTGYKIHTFTSPGTFTVTSGTSTVEVLLVAGGGGGGYGSPGTFSGGGGGGGLLYKSSVSVSPGPYTVTRGAGGAGGVTSPSPGTAGSPSVFGPISIGGGGAGGRNVNPAPEAAGVSGGGAGEGGTAGLGSGNSGGTAGSVSPDNGWGNPGGGPGPNGSGGGGGAGGNGGTGATPQPGGSGGVGLSYSISGSPLAYAGGGGGGGYPPQGPPGPGGSGVGGAGGTYPGGTAGSGTANRGGGGGGAGGGAVGGSGGSGVVIIAYPTA